MLPKQVRIRRRLPGLELGLQLGTKAGASAAPLIALLIYARSAWELSTVRSLEPTGSLIALKQEMLMFLPSLLPLPFLLKHVS